MTGEERVTYRSVLANREFAALVLSQGLSTIGDQLARIAIAILVFEKTGSELAATTTFAVSYLTYLFGGPVLSAISDRRPRLNVMVVCDLVRAPVMLLLCFKQQPLWTFFLGLALVGLLAPPFDSARSGLQPDILMGDAYVVGNALINVVLQFGQVLGFVLGGTLVALASVRGALALDAATFLLSAGVLLAFVRHRAAAQAAPDRSSLMRDTAKGFRFVFSRPDLIRYLTLSVIASVGTVAAEGLAVPVADEIHRGAVAAGFLTAAVPAGFVVGSLLVVRLPIERRLAMLFPLTFACMVPLIASPLVGSPATMTALWFLAGLGSCVNLVASAAYVQACPSDFRSRAYGVAVTGVMGGQGLFLLLSGVLADKVSSRGAVSLIAAALTLLLGCLPNLRKPAQGNREPVR